MRERITCLVLRVCSSSTKASIAERACSADRQSKCSGVILLHGLMGLMGLMVSRGPFATNGLQSEFD